MSSGVLVEKERDKVRDVCEKSGSNLTIEPRRNKVLVLETPVSDSN